MDGIVMSAQTMQLPLEAAPHLKERYERLIDAITSEHAGNMCDESKAFLECIFRTIITDRNGEVQEGSRGHATFMQLYDQARASLNLSMQGDLQVANVMRSAAEVIGVTRNNFGAVSHGQDGYEERTADLQDAYYVARESLSLAAYLYAKHVTAISDNANARIHYDDNPEFNEYLDEAGDVIVAGIAMLPSEVLFKNDPVAYKEQLLEFNNDQEVEYYLDMHAQHEADIMRGK